MAAMDKKQIVAVCAFAGVLFAALIGISAYQNYCAKRAEAEVAREVIRMGKAKVRLIV